MGKLWKAFAQAILEDVVHEHETDLEAFMGEVAKDRHFLKILKEACGFKLWANDDHVEAMGYSFNSYRSGDFTFPSSNVVFGEQTWLNMED